MSSTNIDTLQLFYGKPLLFQDVCLIYSPTLGEIAQIGAQTFYNYISLLTISKKELEKENSEISEIMYLIATSLLNQDFFQLIQQAFLFFIKEKITMIPEIACIQIGELEEQRLLTAENFSEFQTYIKAVCALGKQEGKETSDNAYVRSIQEKIRKGQAIVASLKAEKDNDDPELVDLISAFLANSTEVNIENIWNMCYYTFQTQFRRMQMIEEYDLNIRSALAGAKIPKEKMKHWIRKIQDK